VQSGWHFKRFDPDGFAMSKQLAQEAIEIDPNYYMPYVMLAFLNQRNLPVAEKYAQKALQLDDSVPFSHIAMGLIYRMKGQWEKAIAEGKKALDLEPNGAEMHWHLAAFLMQGGRTEEAIPLFEKALRLNPFPQSFYYDGLGKAYFNVGRYDEAIGVCKKALKRNPRDLAARWFLAAAYVQLGREEEARAQAKEILKVNPKFSISKSKVMRPEKDKLAQNKFIEALRKAGLPE
jgi:tetratricopeptide (TPR) repeat protein